ncbi:per os infectivity factor, viral envelope protein p74 [Microplitis demolitor]|uniref:per os infectivity factor, viral envelope protein p74 n=1 Tax=Microplitis demolitor TaxID=69319 RepID=UPI00044000A7|nr:per os infectivity factor, viral envelope protein p74 [Microplitis demolitor]KAG6558375.1 per os infectivity factor, viral envelope protein p74 [Microplitis demolitor]
MSMTVEDDKNCEKFVDNYRIFETIKYLYEKYPHIISHLKYEIRPADPKKDYYFPDDLGPSSKYPAIVVTTRIEKTLCEDLLSCNLATNEGNCTADSKATRYPVGDADLKKTNEKEWSGMSCQPSCYNLFKEKNGDQKKNPFTLAYHKNQCVLTSSHAKSYMEFPSKRSKVPEHRVTDIPVGFDRADGEHPYSFSGIRYHYNKTYCDSFYDEYCAETKVCYVHWAKKYIGNIILGEYIIKACQALDNYVHYGSDLPPSLMRAEEVKEPDSVFLLKNWLNNIDKSFVLPDEKLEALRRSSAAGRVGSIDTEPEEPTLKDRSRIINNINREERPTLDSGKRRALEEDAKTMKSKSVRVKREAKDELWPEKLFKGIINMLATKDFWVSLGLDSLYSTLLERLKKKVVKTIQIIGQGALKNLVKTVFRQSALRVGESLAFKLASKLIVGLLKVVSQILTVVGILTAVLGFVDMIIGFIDPLELNKKYPDDYIDTFMEMSEHEMRISYDMIKPVLTFKILSTLLLNEEETLSLELNLSKYRLHYCKNLHVNSEGSVIDWGDEVTIPENININFDDVDFSLLRLYSQKDLYEYEKDHMNRIKVVDKIKNINYLCGGALIVCLVLQYFIFVIIIVIAICLLSYVQYLALGIDNISDITYYFL